MSGSSSRPERRIKAECAIEGHEDAWVEFDVSAWSVREYREIPDSDLAMTLERWVETDSVAWNIKGINGKQVKHPGRGAEPEQWLDAYGNIPLELSKWLSITPYVALQGATRPSRKRDGSGEIDSG